MHPQDTVLERARDIARELKDYDQATKTVKELEKLVMNRSLLAEVLNLTNEQTDKAHSTLQNIRHNSEANMRNYLRAGIEA